jgi:hypothetical protein
MKPKEKQTVILSPEVWALVDEYARGAGLKTSAAVRRLVELGLGAATVAGDVFVATNLPDDPLIVIPDGFTGDVDAVIRAAFGGAITVVPGRAGESDVLLRHAGEMDRAALLRVQRPGESAVAVPLDDVAQFLRR